MDDSLVGRRSKRSTAGNRMEAALAEMSIDDLMQDIEEDIDFVSKVDEEDVFESDFASTDEDAQDDDEAGEKVLQDEEKRAKRAARHKPFKVPKAPARKVTFHSPAPDGGDVAQTPKQKPKRVSLGHAVDAETGEVVEMSKRQSNREATRLNAMELQSRLKIAEGRRASLSKKPKEIERLKTQTELIQAALDMEDDNINSHRNYLAIEEEKRKKARVVKASTVGPKIRWRSRVEEVTITVYDPTPQAQRPTWTSPYAPQQPGTSYPNPYSIPPAQPAASGSSTPQTQQPIPAPQYPFTYAPPNPIPPSNNAAASTSKTPAPANNAVASTSKTPSTTTTPTPAPAAPPTAQQHYANQYYPYSYYNPQLQPPHSQYQPYGPYYAYQPQPPSQSPRLQLHPQASLARKSTEKQVKNYVEHLVDEELPQDRPGWRETMDAVFGRHADWDNVKVYVGKNRPIARQIQTCPITGLQARYRDPRTGVPYANAGAFRILTRLVAHEYVWSPVGAPGAVGVFVGHEKQRGAVGVPDAWGDAMAGVEEGWRKKRVDGRREEKAKEREKEVRVGERRSSRIAGEGGEGGDGDKDEQSGMEVDQGGVDEGAEGQDKMVVDEKVA